MVNFLITYDIDNAGERTEFVNNFEDVLQGLGLLKVHTNQSTYYGSYRSKEALATDLFNAVAKWVWLTDDAVTIYYPKVLPAKPTNLPDIGWHALKSKGGALNHVIMKPPAAGK
jgi:hypothetical protein